MLTRATFANFKALKDVAVDLTPFTVIVGKNGAGKTSVLQGIHDLVQGDILARANAPWRLVTRPRTGPMRIALTDAEARTFSVETSFQTDEDGEETSRFMLGLTGTEPELLELTDDTGDSAHDIESASETASRSETKRRFLRRAGRYFGSAIFLRLDARVMVRESVAALAEAHLGFDGAELATVLNSLAAGAPDVLEDIRRDLTAIVPQVRGILTFPARIKRRQRERITVDSQAVYRTYDEEVAGHRFALDMGPGRIIEADLLSEGTVLVLGLLTVLRQPRCPRLVLLDDIDAALHSVAQAELVRAIRAILVTRPDLQIICTSHSPDLLDSVAPEEIRVMALDRDGCSRCARLSDHPESERWRKMLRTGEFWASVGEDWLIEGSGDRG